MPLRDWKGADLSDLIGFLEDRRTEYDGGGTGSVELPWDISGEQYLAFARTDLRQGSLRGRVNALGNAKRALHVQVDSVLFTTGFWGRANEKQWHFPAKIDLLGEMKIAAPNMLGRLNRSRNEVEHGYSAPNDIKQLEDFLDVVELFIAHTRGSAISRYENVDFVRTSRAHELSASISFDGSGLVARLYGPGEFRLMQAKGYRRFRKLQIAVHRAAWREKFSLVQ